MTNKTIEEQDRDIRVFEKERLEKEFVPSTALSYWLVTGEFPGMDKLEKSLRNPVIRRIEFEIVSACSSGEVEWRQEPIGLLVNKRQVVDHLLKYDYPIVVPDEFKPKPS